MYFVDTGVSSVRSTEMTGMTCLLMKNLALLTLLSYWTAYQQLSKCRSPRQSIR